MVKAEDTKCNIIGKVFQILRGWTTIVKSGIKAFNSHKKNSGKLACFIATAKDVLRVA